VKSGAVTDVMESRNIKVTKFNSMAFCLNVCNKLSNRH
jgi:hypothetical protein